MRCSNCEGPFHPATGHALSARSQLCHRCAGRFHAWVVSHTNKKPSKRNRSSLSGSSTSFYECAATSIRATLVPENIALEKLRIP